MATMVRTAATNVLKGLKKELDGLAIGGDAAATQTTGGPVSGVPAAKAEVLVSKAGAGAGRPLLGAKPPRALTDLPDEGGGALRYVSTLPVLAIHYCVCSCSLALSRATPLIALLIVVLFSCLWPAWQGGIRRHRRRQRPNQLRSPAPCLTNCPLGAGAGAATQAGPVDREPGPGGRRPLGEV